MESKARVEALIADGKLEEATAALVDFDGATADYLLGRIEWKRGNRAAAIAAYGRAAAVDPDGPGATALAQAREIMNFFNKDLYNP